MRRTEPGVGDVVEVTFDKGRKNHYEVRKLRKKTKNNQPTSQPTNLIRSNRGWKSEKLSKGFNNDKVGWWWSFGDHTGKSSKSKVCCKLVE